MPKPKTPPPPLSAGKFEEVFDALHDLEGAPAYEISRGQVPLDNLAGALHTAYLQRGPASTETPNIYEVIDALNKRFLVSKLLLRATDKIQRLIEETYDWDEDEEAEEEVKEWADELVREIRKFLEEEEEDL